MSKHSGGNAKAVEACSGKAVLIVDDEFSVLEVTARALKKLGYYTIKAINGDEAVFKYRQNKDYVCLVLMDLLMPIDGYKTIDAIRKIKPSVKIIVTTGATEKKYFENLEGMNIQAVLIKPYPVEKLLDTIQEVLAAA